jgi:hypothetical protein
VNFSTESLSIQSLQISIEVCAKLLSFFLSFSPFQSCKDLTEFCSGACKKIMGAAETVLVSLFEIFVILL